MLGNRVLGLVLICQVAWSISLQSHQTHFVLTLGERVPIALESIFDGNYLTFSSESPIVPEHSCQEVHHFSTLRDWKLGTSFREDNNLLVVLYEDVSIEVWEIGLDSVNLTNSHEFHFAKNQMIAGVEHFYLEGESLFLVWVKSGVSLDFFILARDLSSSSDSLLTLDSSNQIKVELCPRAHFLVVAELAFSESLYTLLSVYQLNNTSAIFTKTTEIANYDFGAPVRALDFICSSNLLLLDQKFGLVKYIYTDSGWFVGPEVPDTRFTEGSLFRGRENQYFGVVGRNSTFLNCDGELLVSNDGVEGQPLAILSEGHCLDTIVYQDRLWIRSVSCNRFKTPKQLIAVSNQSLSFEPLPTLWVGCLDANLCFFLLKRNLTIALYKLTFIEQFLILEGRNATFNTKICAREVLPQSTEVCTTLTVSSLSANDFNIYQGSAFDLSLAAVSHHIIKQEMLSNIFKTDMPISSLFSGPNIQSSLTFSALPSAVKCSFAESSYDTADFIIPVSLPDSFDCWNNQIYVKLQGIEAIIYSQGKLTKIKFKYKPLLCLVSHVKTMLFYTEDEDFYGYFHWDGPDEMYMPTFQRCDRIKEIDYRVFCMTNSPEIYIAFTDENCYTFGVLDVAVHFQASVFLCVSGQLLFFLSDLGVRTDPDFIASVKSDSVRVVWEGDILITSNSAGTLYLYQISTYFLTFLNTIVQQETCVLKDMQMHQDLIYLTCDSFVQIIDPYTSVHNAHKFLVSDHPGYVSGAEIHQFLCAEECLERIIVLENRPIITITCEIEDISAFSAGEVMVQVRLLLFNTYGASHLAQVVMKLENGGVFPTVNPQWSTYNFSVSWSSYKEIDLSTLFLGMNLTVFAHTIASSTVSLRTHHESTLALSRPSYLSMHYLRVYPEHGVILGLNTDHMDIWTVSCPEVGDCELVSHNKMSPKFPETNTSFRPTLIGVSPTHYLFALIRRKREISDSNALVIVSYNRETHFTYQTEDSNNAYFLLKDMSFTQVNATHIHIFQVCHSRRNLSHSLISWDGKSDVHFAHLQTVFTDNIESFAIVHLNQEWQLWVLQQSYDVLIFSFAEEVHLLRSVQLEIAKQDALELFTFTVSMNRVVLISTASRILILNVSDLDIIREIDLLSFNFPVSTYNDPMVPSQVTDSSLLVLQSRRALLVLNLSAPSESTLVHATLCYSCYHLGNQSVLVSWFETHMLIAHFPTNTLVIESDLTETSKTEVEIEIEARNSYGKSGKVSLYISRDTHSDHIFLMFVSLCITLVLGGCYCAASWKIGDARRNTQERRIELTSISEPEH